MSNAGDLDRIREHCRAHPDAEPRDVLEELDLEPSRATVAAVETVKSSDSGDLVGCSPRANPWGNADVRRSRTPDVDNPPDSADRDGSDTAIEAFGDAIDWFAEHLDTELPADVEFDTARDYYREGRGWSNGTIAAKRLGYAPAGRTALLEHFGIWSTSGRTSIRTTTLFARPCLTSGRIKLGT